MSTIFENLITSGFQPDANENLRDHLLAIWSSFTAGGSFTKPTLSGANPNIGGQHIAIWLAISPDARDRLLSVDQQIQFSAIINAAKLKVVGMFKTDPTLSNMRSQCENSLDYEGTYPNMHDDDGEDGGQYDNNDGDQEP